MFLKYPSADEFPGAVLGRGVEAAACGCRMMNKGGSVDAYPQFWSHGMTHVLRASVSPSECGISREERNWSGCDRAQPSREGGRSTSEMTSAQCPNP